MEKIKYTVKNLGTGKNIRKIHYKIKKVKNNLFSDRKIRR